MCKTHRGPHRATGVVLRNQMPLSVLPLLSRLKGSSAFHRGVFALVLAGSSSLTLAIHLANERARTATERLNSAVERLEAITEDAPADDAHRAYVAWGYAERLRLGLESPFLLIESASRDPRLAADERHTVAEALLARVLAGEAFELDPAALDGLGASGATRHAGGEQQLALITRAVGAAGDPRAGELGVRIAFALAAAERLVEPGAPAIVAGAAALIADREIARREAANIIRSARDPVAEVAARRARRSFYVEQPAMLGGSARMQRDAVEIARWVLDSIRGGGAVAPGDSALARDTAVVRLARGLLEAGRDMPPAGPLAVTVRRHLPVVRQARGVDEAAIARARNAEMLAAVAALQPADRAARRAVGRVVQSAAVAMRSQAQDAVWFPGDSAPTRQQVALLAGVAEIVFDDDVPRAWRPYFLRQFADAVTDLRRVLPALRIDAVRVRFRMTPPADSALAMHDPRTRTLHLPVMTAAGTLTHELAHDLDRQSALLQGHLGYRSDWVARNGAKEKGRGATGSVSASLRALTEEPGDSPRAKGGERPAEIFATQVDWFVASALASRGISSGFLSAVQDELLTGHVVHPERLRAGSRGRPLVDALRGMTAVAPFALEERGPGAHALLNWAMSGPVDRGVAAAIMADHASAWAAPALVASCAPDDDPRVALVRLAAESRARGWVRLRARWAAGEESRSWSRAARGEAPWSDVAVERRIARLRDHILLELAASTPLPSGLTALGAPLAARARCG